MLYTEIKGNIFPILVVPSLKMKTISDLPQEFFNHISQIKKLELLKVQYFPDVIREKGMGVGEMELRGRGFDAGMWYTGSRCDL